MTLWCGKNSQVFEALRLREPQVKAEEEALRDQLRNLPDIDRATFYHAYNPKLKDPDTYAVVNWFFIAGIHHFYLGRYLRGAINLLLMVCGILLLFSDYGDNTAYGFAVIVAIFLIELPALFRSQVIVMDFNNRLAREILQQMRGKA